MDTPDKQAGYFNFYYELSGVEDWAIEALKTANINHANLKDDDAIPSVIERAERVKLQKAAFLRWVRDQLARYPEPSQDVKLKPSKTHLAIVEQ